MAKQNSERTRLFREADINWEELAAIGIERNDLELDGDLESLLCGEMVGPMYLSLSLLGVEMELDATLQLIPGKDSPVLEVTGLNSPDS